MKIALFGMMAMTESSSAGGILLPEGYSSSGSSQQSLNIGTNAGLSSTGLDSADRLVSQPGSMPYEAHGTGVSGGSLDPQNVFAFGRAYEALLREHQETEERLDNQVRELSAQCDDMAEQLKRCELGMANATSIVSKMDRLADCAFWAIVLLGGISAITLMLLAVHALFSAAVGDWLAGFLGFLGLSGVLGVLAYIRKLGMLNKRVSELEARKGSSHDA